MRSRPDPPDRRNILSCPICRPDWRVASRQERGSRSRVGCANDRPCKSTRYLFYEIALALEPPTVVDSAWLRGVAEQPLRDRMRSRRPRPRGLPTASRSLFRSFGGGERRVRCATRVRVGREVERRPRNAHAEAPRPAVRRSGLAQPREFTEQRRPPTVPRRGHCRRDAISASKASGSR